MHDLNLALYGTAEPPVAARLLRAGKLEASLEGGNLRSIRFDAIELLRGISFLVRDTGWGTYAPSIEHLAVQEDEGLFEVRYEACCQGAEGRFDYEAKIIGQADGSLTFTAKGHSPRDFPANRIGFVVLHPIKGVAGAEMEVGHADGTRQIIRLPCLISAAQPILNIRRLAHAAAPGLRVQVQMEGDVFEMEDQRNWTDASFKTYVRPLSKPRPFVTAAGEAVHQSVHLSLTDQRQARGAETQPSGATVSLELGGRLGRVPQLGLALDIANVQAAMSNLPMLLEIKPQWLAIRMGGAQPLGAVAQFARDLGARVLAEIIVEGKDPGAEIQTAAAFLAEAGIVPGAVLACPARDMRSRPSGPPPTGQAAVAAILAAARRYFPGALIGGGMLTFFTELNRNPPPAALADFIAHGACATVHAADDLSVMETLEAWPALLHSARHLFGAKCYWLNGVTIGMRENPYGEGLSANPGRKRVPMARFDPRHFSLFGAAWAQGVIAAAVREGVDTLTLAHAAGDFGLVQPKSEGGKPSPLFWLLKGLSKVAGSPCLQISPQPGIAAVAVDDGGKTAIWLANLSPRACAVAVPGLEVRQLEILAAGADGLVASTVTHLPPSPLHLGPFALARLSTYKASCEASHV